LILLRIFSEFEGIFFFFEWKIQIIDVKKRAC
jgi:hypothetical protein